MEMSKYFESNQKLDPYKSPFKKTFTYINLQLITTNFLLFS